VTNNLENPTPILRSISLEYQSLCPFKIEYIIVLLAAMNACNHIRYFVPQSCGVGPRASLAIYASGFRICELRWEILPST
jgi:hypothetical protein